MAGREAEQELIRTQLDWLEHNQATGGDTIFYGPCGNGKTALMAWELREADARGIATMNFSSKEIKSTEWLARYLSIVPRWVRALRGLSALGFGIQTRDSAEGRIGYALARRARRRGLVIEIDEMHTLPIEVGQDTLHVVQRMRYEELPVMLLLAGTTDLPRHLNSMEASFWDRSKILSWGLLRSEAATDAIRIPMEAGGRAISADALTQVVEESHGYPYFLQLWGEMLWAEVSGSSHPISLEAVRRARPRFETARNLYRQNRHAELRRARLAFVAATLASAFRDADKVTEFEVDASIKLG